MERKTFIAMIQSFRGRKPFQPFTVVTVSGNRYEVDHAGAIVERDGTVVFLAPGGFPVFFDYEGISEVIGDLANSVG